MWKLDHKEGWAPKNWYFWIVVLEKALESPLDCRQIKPVNPKENKSLKFTGRADAEANTLATWCKEPTHWKRPWCWERLRTGGEWSDRGWDGWMAFDMNLSKFWEIVKDWEAWHAAVHGVTESRTLLSNWTATTTTWMNVRHYDEWKKPIYTIACCRIPLQDILKKTQL